MHCYMLLKENTVHSPITNRFFNNYDRLNNVWMKAMTFFMWFITNNTLECLTLINKLFSVCFRSIPLSRLYEKVVTDIICQKKINEIWGPPISLSLNLFSSKFVYKHLDYENKVTSSYWENHEIPVTLWSSCHGRHYLTNAAEGWNHKIEV